MLLLGIGLVILTSRTSCEWYGEACSSNHHTSCCNPPRLLSRLPRSLRPSHAGSALGPACCHALRSPTSACVPWSGHKPVRHRVSLPTAPSSSCPQPHPPELHPLLRIATAQRYLCVHIGIDIPRPACCLCTTPPSWWLLRRSTRTNLTGFLSSAVFL